ncbi:MAG: hypothetical protein JST92_06955, partial [Deltaproteobacteria bacterium]|nr:hypothetical protein [Deltaproteobacteria bacterium]
MRLAEPWFGLLCLLTACGGSSGVVGTVSGVDFAPVEQGGAVYTHSDCGPTVIVSLLDASQSQQDLCASASPPAG